MYHSIMYSAPEPAPTLMTDRDAAPGLLATTRYLPRLRLDRAAVLEQHRWMAPGLRALARGRRTIAS